MAKNSKKYDFIVIGDSLSALLTAVENAKRGFKGAIFTGAEALGGLHKGVVLTNAPVNDEAPTTQIIDSHLNFVPNAEPVASFLSELQKHIPALTWTPFDLGPLTYHNGMTQPFLGFGAHNIEAIDFYSTFTQTAQLQLNKTLSEITQELIAQFTGDVFTNNEITSLDVLEGIGHIQTNGSDIYHADRVYFMESPAKLTKVLPAESAAFSKISVQRLSKATLWTSVNLTYIHSTPQTDSHAMHVLFGAKDVPCLGAFGTFENKHVSHWTSILSSENMADTEQLGLTIREMKKQIKRMYPHFLDSIQREFIMIAPDTFGTVPTQVANNPDIFKNKVLFLSSHCYTSQLGIVGDCASYLELTAHFPHTEQHELAEAPL
jgi:hypothetical protein